MNVIYKESADGITIESLLNADMENIPSAPHEPDLVKVENKQVVTTSLQVAEYFEKEHKTVLRSIDDLVAQNCATKDFFHEMSREYRGQTFRYFIMNRDGFSLLAMGFTGKKALDWKIKFIRAFNSMEQELLNEAQLLSPKDRIKVMQCIGKASRYTLPYIILAAKPFLGDIDISSAKPRDRITEGIQLYLNDHDIIGRPTGECHDEYVEFCKANHLVPTNKINFSRKVLEFGQVQILLKKLNGKTRRIFIRR